MGAKIIRAQSATPVHAMFVIPDLEDYKPQPPGPSLSTSGPPPFHKLYGTWEEPPDLAAAPATVPLVPVDTLSLQETQPLAGALSETAQAEAAAILEAARQEAHRLIQDARCQVDDLHQAATEKGLLAGRAQAELEISRAVEPWREQLAQTCLELAAIQSTLVAQTETDLVRLALEIARKIVHREVSVDREVVVALVRVALSRLHSQASARVRLHPDDYHYLVHHPENQNLGHTVEFIKDPSITRGGCLVETLMGDVDARIERQFAEIEHGFLGS